eukprot:gene11919-12063_t
MTLVEEAHSLKQEEVLPLIGALELDISSPSKAAADRVKRPLRQRIRQQLRHVTPELVAIALVYFVQGILRLSSLALTFFEKDHLHMEPAQMAVADTISGLPWAVKPLYGFITDSFPILGMRRRPYLIIAGLTGSFSWLCLAAFASSIPSTVVCITAAAAATAFSDVVADSIVVELARASPGATEGSLQSLCWASHAFGRLITAYLSGWLVGAIGPRSVFCITATFPLVVCLSSCLINEKHLAFSAANGHSKGQQPNGASAETGHEQQPMLAATDMAPMNGVAVEGVGEGRKTSLNRVAGLPAGNFVPGLAAPATTAATLHEYAYAGQLQQAGDENSADDEVLLQDAGCLPLSHRSGATPASPDAAGTASWPSSLDRLASTSKLKRSSKAAPVTAEADGAGLRAQQSKVDSLLESVMLFWNAVKQPHILRPVAFLFLWQAMPAAGTAMFYFKTNKLGFDAEFFGRVKLVAAVADLLGIFVYNTWLKSVRLRPLLLWGSLLGCLLGLTPLMLVEGVNRKLGISDKVFALVDSALLASIGQVLMMPTLVLSARLCPPGVEATLYASLMSMNNAAAATSDMVEKPFKKQGFRLLCTFWKQPYREGQITGHIGPVPAQQQRC